MQKDILANSPRDIIKSFTAREKTVALYYYCEGLTFIQIAGVLGVTRTAVYERHRKVVKKLGFKPPKPWQGKKRTPHNCFTADVNSWNGVG